MTHKVFDRAFTQGLSVTRLHLAKMEDVLALCMKIDQNKHDRNPQRNAELRSMGTISLTAQVVREVKFPGCNSLAFRVYDTALEKNTAHADIVGSKYFGELNALPKLMQTFRNHAQMALMNKVEFVSADPA